MGDQRVDSLAETSREGSEKGASERGSERKGEREKDLLGITPNKIVGIKEKSDWQERRRRLGEGRELGTRQGAGGVGELTEDTEFKKKNQPPKTNKRTSASSDWERKLLAPLALSLITRRGAALTLPSRTRGRGAGLASGLPQARLAGPPGPTWSNFSLEKTIVRTPGLPLSCAARGGGGWGRGERCWREKNTKTREF